MVLDGKVDEKPKTEKDQLPKIVHSHNLDSDPFRDDSKIGTTRQS